MSSARPTPTTTVLAPRRGGADDVGRAAGGGGVVRRLDGLAAADDLEAEVEAGTAGELALRLRQVGRSDRMRRAELASPVELLLDHVHGDDHGRAGRAGTLDDADADTAT